MAKLTEYPAATQFDSGDILIKDGTNGTKKITAENAAADLVSKAVDTTLTQPGKAADAAAVGVEIGNLKSDLSETIKPYIGTYEQYNGTITQSGKWAIRSDRHYIIIPVNPNVELFVAGKNGTAIAYLTDYTKNPANDSSPSFCVGYEGRFLVGESFYESRKTPDDCKYLFVQTYNGNLDNTPSKLLIDGYDYTKTIFDSIRLNNEKLNTIEFTSNNVVNAVLGIAETYFNEAYNPNNAIIYRSQRGIFSNPFYDGVKAMVCSQFSQACFAGIAYENSRFVSGYDSENNPYWWGFVSDGSGNYAGMHIEQKTEPGTSEDEEDYTDVVIVEDWYKYGADYMSASQQCDYFISKGIAHAFNPDHNDIKSGDLLFYLASTWNPTIKDTEDDYISHVGICVKPYKSRYSFIHANSNGHRKIDSAETALLLQEWLYESTPPSYYVHLEDISIPASKTTSELIHHVDWNNISGSISGNTRIGPILTATEDWPLERGFYTINTKLSGDCDVNIAQVFSDNSFIVNRSEVKAGESSIVIYVQSPITRIDLYVTNGTTYTIKETNVYKGYHSYDD